MSFKAKLAFNNTRKVTETVTHITSGTFTVPAGVTTVLVEAWGAGGGGGGSFVQKASGILASPSPWSAGGAGGAGGSHASNNLNVMPGQLISFTIGQGGAGGVGYTSHGANGGNTAFSINDFYTNTVQQVVAMGGFGGTSSRLIYGASNVGIGGSFTSSSIGKTTKTGGSGANGFVFSSSASRNYGGAGGGGAGTITNGTSASVFSAIGGAGGSLYGRSGGTAPTRTTSGGTSIGPWPESSVAFGAGGAGSVCLNTTTSSSVFTATGGSGSNGGLILTYRKSANSN